MALTYVGFLCSVVATVSTLVLTDNLAEVAFRSAKKFSWKRDTWSREDLKTEMTMLEGHGVNQGYGIATVTCEHDTYPRAVLC